MRRTWSALGIVAMPISIVAILISFTLAQTPPEQPLTPPPPKDRPNAVPAEGFVVPNPVRPERGVPPIAAPALDVALPNSELPLSGNPLDAGPDAGAQLPNRDAPPPPGGIPLNVDPFPDFAAPPLPRDEAATYVIGMLVLEGSGLKIDGPAQRTLPPPAAPPPRLPAPLPQPAPPSAERPTLPAPPATVAEPVADADLWDRAVNMPGVSRLASPIIRMVGGQPGTVQIQSQQTFTYMVPVGEGKFKARQTPVHLLGMFFTLQVHPVEGEEEMIDLSPLEIQISALDGREPVAGLDLEVGPPIISTRSLKTTSRMKLGSTRLIVIPSGPKTQAVLLLRVHRVGKS